MTQNEYRTQAQLIAELEELRSRVAEQVGDGDSTSFKQSEEALRKSEEKYSKAFHATPDAIVLAKTSDGTLVEVNEGFERIFGFQQSEAVGRTSIELGLWAKPTDRERFLTRLRADGEVRDFEAESRTRAGTQLFVEVSAVPIDLGSEPHILVVNRDITERKQAEEDLRKSRRRLHRAQKMESLGLLAGGVAHDFNNLLTVILGYTELVKAEIAAAGLTPGGIDAIGAAGARAARLTQRLLAFSRSQVVAPRVVDPNQVMLEIDGMLRRVIGSDVELVSIPDPDLDLVKVDVGQFEQVLVNLAVNARDAMRDGGKLTLETRNVLVDESVESEHSGLERGRHVMVSVSDSGFGMTEEVKAQIFEPLFTTKAAGKGTGLGLAICSAIVKESGGHISVDSELGAGTTFRVYFPAVEGESEAFRDDEPTHAPAARGGEVILFVDDEPQVRNLAVRVLRAKGYTVLDASCGIDALEVARQREDIDLLITDLIMPKMGGARLTELLSKERSGLKVLYTSGYAPDGAEHIDHLNPTTTFLAKPFTPTSLATRVREILDRSSL